MSNYLDNCSITAKDSFSNINFEKDYPFAEWKNGLEADEDGKLLFHEVASKFIEYFSLHSLDITASWPYNRWGTFRGHRMQFTVGNFIDNQMILPENGKKAPVYNLELEKSQEKSFFQTQKKHKGNQFGLKALKEWSETPPLKRARVLFKFKELLDQYKKDLGLS